MKQHPAKVKREVGKQRKTKRSYRTSGVWAYFHVVVAEPHLVTCSLCSNTVSRGSKTTRSFTTTNMRRHLEKKHGFVATQIDNALKNHKREIPESQTSISPIQAVQPSVYQPQHSRQQLLNKRLMEMICLDCLPFKFIENAGFRNFVSTADPRYEMPSSEHFSNTELDQLYNEYESVIRTIINNIAENPKSLALTVDIWSSPSLESYRSLTAHFLNSQFTRQSIILGTTCFKHYHTDDKVFDIVEMSLRYWSIPWGSIIALVNRDGETSMASEASTLDGHFPVDWPSICCVEQAIQMAVREGVGRSNYIASLFTICLRVMDRFRDPSFERQILDRVDESKHKSVKLKIIQANNSYFAMLRLLNEFRLELDAIAAELLSELEDNEWSHIEQLIELLKPISELSFAIESCDASIGLVIPGVRLLLKRLETSCCEDEKFDVEVARTAIRFNLENRFSHLNENELFSFGTLLDPRFKIHGFGNKAKANATTLTLIKKLEELPVPIVIKKEPPPKVKNDKGSNESIWAGLMENDDNYVCVSESVEVHTYLALPICTMDENVGEWWQKNELQFPKLSLIARQVFCVPPTTSNSERLFSDPENEVVPWRSSHELEEVKKIAFIKKNYSLVNSFAP